MRHSPAIYGHPLVTNRLLGWPTWAVRAVTCCGQTRLVGAYPARACHRSTGAWWQGRLAVLRGGQSMIRTRVVVTTALIAASAMILAACGSSPGQSTGTTSASSAASSAAGSASSAASSPASAASSETGGASSSSSAASSGGTGVPAHRRAPTATSAGARPASNGCGTPHGAYTQPPAAAAGTVVTGLDELATSWNNATSHGNSVYNAIPGLPDPGQRLLLRQQVEPGQQRLVHHVHRDLARAR